MQVNFVQTLFEKETPLCVATLLTKNVKAFHFKHLDVSKTCLDVLKHLNTPFNPIVPVRFCIQIIFVHLRNNRILRIDFF